MRRIATTTSVVTFTLFALACASDPEVPASDRAVIEELCEKKLDCDEDYFYEWNESLESCIEDDIRRLENDLEDGDACYTASMAYEECWLYEASCEDLQAPIGSSACSDEFDRQSEVCP